ncbi:hypothetical protein N1495_04705 [Streptococcus didelphis]|uniref:Glycosyltransferase subfamily 4-like N-terminal domain-containing protein n=1 Tax=Streptococcus didelphis TaxID=102886 RepID=A0ABY9LH66_9STRE|nr:hypothetical protein [Streptococcus didelphis]WMB28199.1 hypothetical protein N1496_00290 [Streptococcus didelphis]WMB30109.1 hypothetical protein N1495_04705 [Streptococcus didelphis]
MKKDKAVIISYYRWWDKRQRFFYEFYINQGYEVNYYVSSFNHITKKVDMIDVPEIAEIVVSPRYYSNFSFRRIYSNIIFSIKVIRKLNISKPKVIVVLLPSNILAAFTSIYSKMNNTSLIVDILDLWPESLPVNKKIKVIFSPIFSLWSFLRKIAIKASDLVILECNYYNDILKRDLVKKIQRFYIFKSQMELILLIKILMMYLNLYI